MPKSSIACGLVFKMDFSFRGGELKIPGTLELYLRSAQATYNGSGMTFHDDGHPTEVDLTYICSQEIIKR